MNPNRLDRRRFLFGTGATLALPMLEAFAPRTAFAQTAPAPKRLLIIAHQDGRLAGDGQMLSGAYNDLWSPARVTGPLPTGAALSPMLAPLQAIRNEVVTVDGVDNLMRHVLPDTDNHVPAQNTILTCRNRVNGQVPSASFDYQMGLRLRANSSMRTAPVIMGTAADYTWRMGNTAVFFGPNGTAPDIVEPDPAAAITDLFGMPTGTMTPPPPTPTLKDRLTKQRKSVLDGVLSSFNTLRGQVNAADRARLDNHADFVRALEQRASMPTDGGTAQMAMGCQRPNPASVPSNQNGSGGVYLRGEKDGAMMPAIIENMVQTFACDVTRVQSLFFWQADDPVFPTQFSGTNPFANGNWHTVIHGVPRIGENATDAGDLTKTYNFYAQTFTTIVQRLAAMTDTDGTRMLDNTLVLWVSEMGYGSVHAAYNIPVVMAGMKAAFSKGQGRHVVCNRRSMGDLLAQVMRMYGGTEMTFGDTGTLGQYATDLHADAGWPGYINSSTPLHSGALDL